jgi:hypothetical protein
VTRRALFLVPQAYTELLKQYDTTIGISRKGNQYSALLHSSVTGRSGAFPDKAFTG